MFFHFLFHFFFRFSFIFRFSFVFFSFFLSFSFSLLGAQNLIFSGPQFRYDFFRQFLCKKSVFGPVSGGGTPLGPLFLFFIVFFPCAFVFLLFF